MALLRVGLSLLFGALTAPARSRVGPSGARVSEHTMPDTAANRSTLGLISDALSQASELIGSEVRLARTEIGEKIGTAITAIAGIAVAAVFLIVALIFLLQAAVACLVEIGWRSSQANLVVGALVGVIALITAFIAKSRLSIWRLTPQRSIDQAGKTVDVIRGKNH